MEDDRHYLGRDFSVWLPTLQQHLASLEYLWNTRKTRPDGPGLRLFCAHMAHVAVQLGC